MVKDREELKAKVRELESDLANTEESTQTRFTTEHRQAIGLLNVANADVKKLERSLDTMNRQRVELNKLYQT